MLAAPRQYASGNLSHFIAQLNADRHESSVSVLTNGVVTFKARGMVSTVRRLYGIEEVGNAYHPHRELNCVCCGAVTDVPVAVARRRS